MSTQNRTHVDMPRTVAASLDARLAPFGLNDVTPQRTSRQGPRLINDLKLLFAALGAGGSAVPLGDNGRTARFLSSYAASLRDH